MEGATIPDRRSELRGIFADEQRFRAWYETASRRVYAYLFGRSGGDAGLAEELTQQVFVEAIRHRDSFDGRSDSITWLIAIGRNRLIDHLRRLEREERRHLRLIAGEIGRSEQDQGLTRSHDDRAEVLQALRDVPASQRAVLILHHVDGLPLREVARLVGKSQTAVESLLSRGRQSFKVVYEEQERG